MGRSTSFIAPAPSPVVQGLFRAALPILMPAVGVAWVDYDPNEIAALRARADARILLTPNHPTDTDPAILFHLGATLGQPFLYLACRESFDAFFGLWGHVVRRLGAYSIVRGTTDRPSFRATRDLLARPRSKVVVFPEGETYSQNDTLLPFHDGPFQLAFWALEDARRTGDDAAILVQPVAIKYFFLRDMTGPIRASLTRLERFTGSPIGAAESDYRRLRGISWAMLRSLERDYRLGSPRQDDVDADFTPRLLAIKEAILERVAAAAGVPDPTGATLPERMRTLIHAIETVVKEDVADTTPYDHALHRLQRERAAPLLWDLRRLSNFIAVFDGYVRADPTPERMADTLVRLERECFGRVRLKGPRRCRVRLPEPIDLAARMDAYRADRRSAVRSLATDTEAAILARLHERDPDR